MDRVGCASRTDANHLPVRGIDERDESAPVGRDFNLDGLLYFTSFQVPNVHRVGRVGILSRKRLTIGRVPNRAANILRIEEKKDDRRHDQTVDAKALQQTEELALHGAIETAASATAAALRDEDFAAAMTALAVLRPTVDAFFDEVTVNADEPVLRTNRLALLNAIVMVMNSVADFGQIEG